MKYFYKFVYRLLVAVIMVSLSACAVTPAASHIVNSAPAFAPGDVLGIHPGTAFRVVTDAIRGAPNTYILMKDNCFLFAKTISNGWAFVGVNAGSQKSLNDIAQLGLQGNYTDIRSWSELVGELKNVGWKELPYQAVSTAIIEATIAGQGWIAALAQSLSTWYVLPAGIFFSPAMEPYQSERG